MQGILYEEPSFFLFALVNIVMGGAAAWATGRALARTWRPFWQIAPAALALGAVVRFLHFALFKGTLLSAHYYAVDVAIVFAAAAWGYRAARAGQMATQYSWIYAASGPLSWRAKA